MIYKFEYFSDIDLIVERLHINDKIDKYSDKIYPIIKNSEKYKFEFIDLPIGLNISKLTILLKDMRPGLSGELDVNKSHKTDSGWTIHINLKKDFALYTLKHELNHALRLTLIGKDKVIKNLNWVKSQNIFLSKTDEIEYFFYLIYLANDEEITARVMETNGLIKEVMSKWGTNNLDFRSFDYIIKGSDAFRQANELINFKSDVLFNNYDKNKLNKLFYLLEENKSELDRIQSGRFSKIKLIIKLFRDLFKNSTSLEREDNKIYRPNRGKKFYDVWIPKQGEKLKRRIYNLYDLYQK